jgi:hypothetical protein
MLALVSTLVVIIVIVATQLLGRLATKRRLQASALPHSVLGVLVDRTRAIHELGEVSFIGAFGANVGGVDGVVKPTSPSLSAS